MNHHPDSGGLSERATFFMPQVPPRGFDLVRASGMMCGCSPI
ncbi:MAG: hypothetical protein WCH98_17200 [Verrucomicrobiota bacterium]